MSGSFLPSERPASRHHSERPAGRHRSEWTPLQIAKLAVAALIPIVLLIVGTQINGSVRAGSDAARKADDDRAALAARQSAIAHLARLVHERQARAALLIAALRRSDSFDELRERKRSYDETYVAWNANRDAELVALRPVFGTAGAFANFDAQLDFRLTKGIFSPLDGCVSDAYEKRMKGEDAKAALEHCAFGSAETTEVPAMSLVQAAGDCGAAFTDELVRVVAAADGIQPPVVYSDDVDRRCVVKGATLGAASAPVPPPPPPPQPASSPAVPQASGENVP
jgi:hypothetical protein